MRAKLKLLLLGFVLAVAVAGAVRAYDRASEMQEAVRAAGYVAWPAGADEDVDYFWKMVPGRYFDLIGVDQPGVGAGVLVVGFALWMGLLGVLLRRTPVPYIVSVASLAFSFLCTGGFAGAKPVPAGLVVDAGTRIISDDGGKAEALCEVARVAEDERDAVKGGPDYWVVAHFGDGRAEDLMVFDSQALAVYLVEQIEALQANAGCAAK
jgi:hypothetical protein